MKPIGLRNKSGKGLQVVHRCMNCGMVSANRVASRTVQPDELEALLCLPPD